jgi:hypothetical protein
MPKLVTALKEAQVVNAKPEKEASYRMFDGGGLFFARDSFWREMVADEVPLRG